MQVVFRCRSSSDAGRLHLRPWFGPNSLSLNLSKIRPVDAVIFLPSSAKAQVQLEAELALFPNLSKF